jgi:large subunit ribosomal protein L10
MHKSDKERVVAELTERLRTTDTLIVADYRGLTMPQIDGLRSALLEHGARFTVVKNTLTRRAAEAAGADAVLALLEGPTAIAFLDADGDPVAVAKALGDAARETRVLEVRGGVLEGRQISAGEVENLAKLPPAEVLRAQLVGALAAPMATVVGLFNAPLRDLVGMIDARIRQLEESGEDPSAGRAEPSGAPQAADAEAAPAGDSQAPADEAAAQEGTDPEAAEPEAAEREAAPEAAEPEAAEPEAAEAAAEEPEAAEPEAAGPEAAEAEASESDASEPQAEATAEDEHGAQEEQSADETTEKDTTTEES